MPLCSSLKGFAMRKHIRTSLTLLIVALAAASIMLILPGCAGGSNDSPGKPDAVGNRSADGASEATQGDVVSTAMVAYANGDQVLFVDQETQTPYIPTEIDDATIIVDGQQTDEEALVAGNIVQVTGNGIMLESYPGQYPGITKVEVIETGSPADAEQYADIVEKTREYIFDGDIFQAVQSRQFSSPYQDSLLSAYRVLRTTNPSPYMVFLSIDGDEIMCSSPETLVRLDNGRLTTFPVAGSRPRGKTPEEDKALENELLADEKELSEHNMLVDLGRNDLGRVSKIGTVEVTDYMMIHRYSKIMHICSQVEGDIDEKYDACDAIEAVLPAGTLSGAPKIRACEIIEEQESEPRGVYGGALGYLDFTGNMDTCIAIRMAAKKNGIVTVQAGGGIVADSVPHNEYMESANKAKAVMNAIERASEVDG